jgi:hypothetical protein
MEQVEVEVSENIQEITVLVGTPGETVFAESLQTVSTDPDLVLKPNGTGGVLFAPATRKIIEVSASHNASTAETVWCDPDGGDFPVVFPAPVAGHWVTILNVGNTGTVTADGNGAIINDTETTFDLIPGESVTWISNGTKWEGQ